MELATSPTQLDAVDRARLALIRLACGDDLAAGGDQVETVLAVRPFLSTNLAAMRPPSVGACLLGGIQSPPSATRKRRSPTTCMPCHPHPSTRPSTALLGTASTLLNMGAGRGAVVRREAACGIAADNLLTEPIALLADDSSQVGLLPHRWLGSSAHIL
jgi:hypothetical protein